LERKKRLWKDYYTGLKPRCQTCLKKGITPDQYAFCSPEKKIEIVRNEEGEAIHTFNNIYVCQVYHWTKFQGQGRIKPPTIKISYKTPFKNHSREQNYSNYQNSIKL
jgi:hypothetical protein